MDFDQLAQAIVEILQTTEIRHSWEEYPLRCSGLPPCARDRYLFVHYPAERRPSSVESFDDIILQLGTATHSVLQKWLGVAGLLLGNWECHNPKCITFVQWAVELSHVYDRMNVGADTPEDQEFIEKEPRREVVKWAVGSQKCPKCGYWMVYEELCVIDDRLEPHLTGHPDGILVFDPIHPERRGKDIDLTDPNLIWILLEAKTINPQWKNNKELPLPSHKCQANSYATLVPRNYSVPRIDAILFLYINRGWPREVTPYVVKPDWVAYEQIAADVVQQTDERSGSQIPAGVCDIGDPYKYCTWKLICMSPFLGRELGKSDAWDGKL